MSAEKDVARTLLSLANAGDMVANVHRSSAADVAIELVADWQSPPKGRTSSRASRIDGMARTLKRMAANDPIHDLPAGSYRYVARAVAETIERGLHLDPLAPGATGYVNRGRNSESLRQQFRATLTAFASSMGYRVDAVDDGRVQSFESFVLTRTNEPCVWVLVHHTIPTFAATLVEPAYPFVSSFCNPEICHRDGYGPWSFAASHHLDAPLTVYLMSQLDRRDREDIERNRCETVGEALFNFFD